MFDKLRQLEISLAAKCQLLFGAAVVMIVAAALFVPWKRMEDLMGQLNERSAGAVADRVLMEHIAQHKAQDGQSGAATRPTALPTTQPVTVDQRIYIPA